MDTWNTIFGEQLIGNISADVTKKFIGCFTGFSSASNEAVNEKPIDGKYSGYADAFYICADIDYV